MPENQEKESVEQRVLKLTREKFGEDISLETNLAEIKMDSLDRIELVMDLEEEFNIKIPEDDFTEYKNEFSTVSGIVKYINLQKGYSQN